MDTVTMALTEFLLARIAEDEDVARECTTGPWEAWADGSVMAPEASPTYLVARVASWNLPHIARHDPARVLAECEAKRRIVELHARCAGGYGLCSDQITGRPCDTIRALAAVYADHPDYREEWRP